MADESVVPWRAVYAHLQTLAEGDIVTYDRLSEIIGLKFTDNRAPYYRALKELEAHDMHTMVPVTNIGYRVVEAPEHEGVFRTRHRAGARKVRRAADALTSANRSKMTRETRDRFDRLEVTALRHADMLRRLNGDVRKVKEETKEIRRETQSDLASMQEQIDVLTEKQAMLDRLTAALHRTGNDDSADA